MLKRESCNVIINCIFEKLERFILNPRIAINCLNLIDFLLKNGSSRFKNEIENERRTIRKYSEYYSEEEEELNEPINNLAKKLVDLIDNPSKLQSERDEAAKLKNRIQGVSNEQPTQEYFSDSRYGGYSSENYSKNSTDNTKPVETPNELMETVEEKVKEPVIVADDIDLLGDNEEEEAKEVVDIVNPVKKKVKKFLPPPPKKSKNAAPRFKRKEKGAKQQEPISQKQEDLTDINIDVQKTEIKPEITYDKPTAKTNSNDLDFDLFGDSISQPTNDTQKQTNNTETGAIDTDLTDLSNLKAEVTKQENYLDLLTGQPNLLTAPPKKKSNPMDKYDFI